MTDSAPLPDTPAAANPGTGAKLPPPSPPRFHGMRRYRVDPHKFMHELFRDYGDIVRWRGIMDVYLVNHPDFVRKVLTQSHVHYSKRTIDYRVLAQTMGNGLVTNEGPHWVKQRRLMQPVFSSRNVNAFDTAINDRTAALVGQWRDRETRDPVWVDRAMMRLAFQIVGATLFGTEIDAHADEVGEILDIVNLQTQEFRALMTLYSWIPTPYNRKWKKANRRLDRIVYGMIAARRAEGIGDSDILARLLSARDEDSGEPMGERQIRDEVVTLLLAGHETSANALAWTLHLLATHADIDARLAAELDGALAGRPATAADLPRIPYLKQVVQESMRLYPPVWAIARRSEHDDVFGGHYVPARAYVGVVPYALHRHPDYWPEPERFDPERFDPNRADSRNSYCYLPFAAGPRTCIGAGMAMLETQLVLAQLVQQFRFASVPGHPIDTLAKVTLRPRFGMPLSLAPRR